MGVRGKNVFSELFGPGFGAMASKMSGRPPPAASAVGASHHIEIILKPYQNRIKTISKPYQNPINAVLEPY